MTAEGRIVKGLKARLEALGYVVIKLHGGPMQLAGIPDLLAIKGGRAVWVEAKQPGKQPTALQAHWLDLLRKAGCVAGVCTSLEDLQRLLSEAGVNL